MDLLLNEPTKEALYRSVRSFICVRMTGNWGSSKRAQLLARLRHSALCWSSSPIPSHRTQGIWSAARLRRSRSCAMPASVSRTGIAVPSALPAWARVSSTGTGWLYSRAGLPFEPGRLTNQQPPLRMFNLLLNYLGSAVGPAVTVTACLTTAIAGLAWDDPLAANKRRASLTRSAAHRRPHAHRPLVFGRSVVRPN
jgi:hypothetical protein